MGNDNVTPIRSDIATAAEPKRKRREPRGRRISTGAMNDALCDQRIALFQAMGIVRLATATLRNLSADRETTDAWTALEGAYAILSTMADRLESSETMLADEVPRSKY